MEWNTLAFDWNHVRAFLVTAQEGSLSAAARALGTTQPTLSRQVAALEAALGVTLFERVGKGVMLTEAGANLLQHAQQMGEVAGLFSLAAAGESGGMEGRVSISASEIDAHLRLPRLVERLQRLEPGIQLEIVVTNEASDLRRREADIALRSFRPTEPDLIARKLLDEPIGFYGSRRYLAQFEGQPPEAIFPQLKVIGFEHNERLIELANSAGWPIGPANFTTFSHSHTLHWQLVRAGLGLSIFPAALGVQDAALQIALPELGPLIHTPLWLVCHRELRTNPRVRRVFDILVELLG